MTTQPYTHNASSYGRIGVPVAVCRVSDRVYELMETEIKFAAVRAMHEPNLAPMREPRRLERWTADMVGSGSWQVHDEQACPAWYR